MVEYKFEGRMENKKIGMLMKRSMERMGENKMGFVKNDY